MTTAKTQNLEIDPLRHKIVDRFSISSKSSDRQIKLGGRFYQKFCSKSLIFFFKNHVSHKIDAIGKMIISSICHNKLTFINQMLLQEPWGNM